LELKNMVKSWAICFNYFILRFDDEDNEKHNNDYFWIYDLSPAQDKEGSYLHTITCISTSWLGLPEEQEKDPFKYLALNNNKFYVANSSEIRVVNLRLNKMSGI
jgi:hypothetical protein